MKHIDLGNVENQLPSSLILSRVVLQRSYLSGKAREAVLKLKFKIDDEDDDDDNDDADDDDDEDDDDDDYNDGGGGGGGGNDDGNDDDD